MNWNRSRGILPTTGYRCLVRLTYNSYTIATYDTEIDQWWDTIREGYITNLVEYWTKIESPEEDVVKTIKITVNDKALTIPTFYDSTDYTIALVIKKYYFALDDPRRSEEYAVFKKVKSGNWRELFSDYGSIRDGDILRLVPEV